MPLKSNADKNLELNFARDVYINGVIAAANRLSIDPCKDQLDDEKVNCWKQLLVENRDEKIKLDQEHKMQQIAIPGTSHTLDDLMKGQVRNITLETYEQLHFSADKKIPVLDHFPLSKQKEINDTLNQLLKNDIKDQYSTLSNAELRSESEMKKTACNETTIEFRRQGAIKKLPTKKLADETLLQKRSDQATNIRSSLRLSGSHFFAQPTLAEENNKREALANKRKAMYFKIGEPS